MQHLNQNKEREEGSSSSSKVLHFHPEYIDDTTLWNAFRNGDDRALLVIFDQYSQSLYNYGCKIHADREVVKDHVQDLFLDLCRKTGSLGETNSIKFYLFKALRRRLVHAMEKRSMPVDAGADLYIQSPEEDIIDSQSAEQQKSILSDRMARLTTRQREAIFLRYYEELSYDRIALIMGVRKQSIYNLINESFEVLKK